MEGANRNQRGNSICLTSRLVHCGPGFTEGMGEMRKEHMGLWISKPWMGLNPFFPGGK